MINNFNALTSNKKGGLMWVKKTSIMIVIILIAVPFGCRIDVSGGWVSPGSGQTYTLQWLDANTNVVNQGDPGVFYLVDDMTISQNDCISFSAGQQLYITSTKKMIVQGNWDINGNIGNNVYISTVSGTSVINNIEWEYTNNNWYDIDYLDVDDINIRCKDENQDVLKYNIPGYTQDTSPFALSDDFVVTLNDITAYYVWRAIAFADWAYQEYLGDTDSDGMPNWWEINNGLNPGNSNDASGDPDSDLLLNLDEFYASTDPNNWDTDADTVSDKEEVIANPYTSDPLSKHSDIDNLRDDDEYSENTDPRDPDTDDDQILDWEEVNIGTDGYITNPLDEDSDDDTLDDYYEIHNWNSNPNSYDTDDDDIPDMRDNEPSHANRRFAFIWECNYYSQPALHPELTPNDDEVAINLAFMGWNVFIYSDCDEYDFEDYPSIYYKDYEYQTEITWGWAWSDFKSRPDPDVGNPPSGYGNDIVTIHITSHGDTRNSGWPNYDDIFEFIVYEWPCDYHIQEDNGGPPTLEDSFDDIGGANKGYCIDLLWVHSCNSWGWEDDIVDDDDLNAGSRIIILADDTTSSSHAVWTAVYTEYFQHPNNGFEAAWNTVENSAQDMSNLTMHDKYTKGDGNFYLW